MDVNERARRYRARKRGEDVPKLQPGAKRGYVQSPDHVAKRIKSGEEHHAWKGEDVSELAGRSRALRWYAPQPCEACGVAKAERHHIDGNTANNSPSNIRFVCRRCHMAEDGRLERFVELAKKNQAKAIAARSAMPKPTHCPRGHEYTKFNKRGSGVCYICLNESKREKRRMDKECS